MSDVAIDLETEDSINSKDRRKKSKKKIYPIIIGIIVIAIIAAIIKFDVGKISSKYIAPKIQNVPIVKNILPKTKEVDLYEGHSKAQLINLLNGSQQELDNAQDEIEDKLKLIDELERQIESLKAFEKEHLEFKENKQLFDAQVAAVNEEEFIKFYQQMYPENAQDIYAELIKVQQLTKEQKKHASLISEMDASKAAKVLENLFQTDIDVILAILSNMEIESASAILAEMDSKIASTVVKQLAPN